MATRITKERQEALGFDDPNAFNDALTRLENQGIQNAASLFAGDTKDIVQTPISPNVETGDPEVNVEDLGTEPVETPEGGDATSQAQQSVQDILDTIQSVAGETSQEETEAESRLRRAEEQLFNVQGLTSERAQEEAALEEQLGVSDAEKQIFDLASTAALKKASLQKGLVDQEGRPIAQTFITGRQAQMKRLAAAELEGISAAIEAQKNNILAAESRIDRALQRKYGDIESRIQQAKTFLDINDSRFTRAEKKAARERQAELAVLQEQLDRKKDREKQAQDAIMTAISNGFNATKGANLSEKLVRGEIDSSEVIAEVGGSLRDPLKVLQEQQLRSKIQVARNAQKSGVLTEDQLDTALKLNKQVTSSAQYKDIQDISNGLRGVISSSRQKNGAGDIAMVNAFQRLIDPGATVREGDVKLLQTAQSLFADAQAKANRFTAGAPKFSETFRQNLIDTATDLYNAQTKAFTDSQAPLRKNAEARGIDFEEYVLPDFATAEEITGALDESELSEEIDQEDKNAADAIWGEGFEFSPDNYLE